MLCRFLFGSLSVSPLSLNTFRTRSRILHGFLYQGGLLYSHYYFQIQPNNTIDTYNIILIIFKDL